MQVSRGRPFPLGATVTGEGINFALFSRHATCVYLELYAAADETSPTATLRLDGDEHRTGDIWHIHVAGLGSGQLYGYRVDGPYAPEQGGHRFNVNKLLYDPYSRGFAGRYQDAPALYGYDRGSPRHDLCFDEQDSAPYTVRSVATAREPFDWGDDRPLRTPWDRTVLYEMHVRGFTAHPSGGIDSAPGTYGAVLEKIAHLRALGITAVELLPVHEFDAEIEFDVAPSSGRPLTNYWGYASLGFFAPHRGYAADGRHAVHEFKQMVRGLHRAGIEVILDVVYNHTGEGDESGPTLSFRGLDNAIYYQLEHPGRHYRNYAGTGNCLACSHPVVKRLIIDSLRYWVMEMHVDGFRFDLAPILARGRDGAYLARNSLLDEIADDPILRRCKLISESWDADGLYLVGRVGPKWAEWNDRFRDDVRQFIRGSRGKVADLARRIGGSAGMFSRKPSASCSVNLITCHDGFTLRDTVSYERKHNEENGEDNRDGASENYSHNWGVEGPSDDPALERLRARQAKNLLVALLVARGTPMLLAGDELWRTQRGNNNAYCQDNEISWIDWRLDELGAEMLRFTRMMIAIRAEYPALRHPHTCDPFGADADGDVSFHGVNPRFPDWGYHSHSLGVLIGTADDEDCALYAIFNAWRDELTFEIPQIGGDRRWQRVVDTAREAPDDILEQPEPLPEPSYCVQAHSAVVLVSS